MVRDQGLGPGPARSTLPLVVWKTAGSFSPRATVKRALPLLMTYPDLVSVTDSVGVERETQTVSSADAVGMTTKERAARAAGMVLLFIVFD